MKLFSAIGLVAMLALGGCSNLKSIYNAATDLSISPSQAILAGNSFDALKGEATVILVACTPKTRPAACNDVSIRQMNGWVAGGTSLRNSIEASALSSPPQNASNSLYQKLQTIITSLTNAVGAYNTAKAGS